MGLVTSKSLTTASLASMMQPPTPLSTLLSASLLPLPQWYYVNNRFDQLFKNMQYSQTQIENYNTKLVELECCLNAKYWPVKTLNDITFIVVGSWLKNTAVRTCSDIDIIFLLPYSVYNRYYHRKGNRQSALLQEIKEVLSLSYPTTYIKGDGPTVVINFNAIKVEIAPAILDPSGSRIITDWDFKTFVCYTKGNGYYGITAPIAEALYTTQINQKSNGNLVNLIKMLKLWKKQCNVPIKTIALQMMAERFINQNTRQSWAAWLIRDFFAYMITQKNKFDVFPATGEVLEFSNTWASYVQIAAISSKKACDYEQLNYNSLAGEQWQKIFGRMIPKEV